MLRFGQQSADEYFVSEPARKKGVLITNTSRLTTWCCSSTSARTTPDMPRTV